MTDDKFPPNHEPDEGIESQRPRSEEQGLTWERPADGSPVYGMDQKPGDPPQPAPPPRMTEAPGPSPPMEPLPGPPPVGPAHTPGEMGAYGGPPPPPDYGYGQGYGPPPPQGLAQDYQYPGYQQPPGAGYDPYQGYGQGYPPPSYQQAIPPNPNGRKYLHIGLGLSITGFLLVCCCWPLTLIAGLATTALAKPVRDNARERGERDPYAEALFFIGIGLAILAVVIFILNIIVYINDPTAAERILQQFLNR